MDFEFSSGTNLANTIIGENSRFRLLLAAPACSSEGYLEQLIRQDGSVYIGEQLCDTRMNYAVINLPI